MKAKDLTGRNIEDIRELGVEADSGELKPEDDQVAAAYENISKKLSSLRGGKVGDSEDAESQSGKDADGDEAELEEWKGPKPPVKEELRPEAVEEDEDIRKVKLKNLENDKEDEDEEEEETAFMKKGKADEPEEDEADDSEIKPKEWKPAKNDPLDEELDEVEIKKSNKVEAAEELDKEEDLVGEIEEKPTIKAGDADSEAEEKPIRDVEDENTEKTESVHSEFLAKPDEAEMEADLAPKAGPDTLDDLADETPFAPKSEIPQKTASETDQEDEYAIPNLKGSRQMGSEMGYNAPSQREGVGQSYSPRANNMDGNNDPNNFFSQHQPQPAKRANKFHLLVLVIIGIVVIGFTVYILKGGFGDIKIGTTQPSPSPSATATPEPTPTATPEPEVDRGAFTVRVLNGTATSGLAGKVRDKLKETGYKTSTPGNAAETDVEQTEIRVKEGSESAALVQRLILDLAPDYEAKEGEKLDDKVAYDAEVTIGNK